MNHPKKSKKGESILLPTWQFNFHCANCGKSKDILEMHDNISGPVICKDCYRRRYKSYKINKRKIGRPVKVTFRNSYKKEDTGKRKGLFL